ncbi:MAG TPA: FtsX-like permease family protein [Caulobacteraceae bacterium]|jgi:putative ABC transport system permease protein|nr:FtsX-like permease family protein [Caulobacteraceae bacterium]
MKYLHLVWAGVWRRPGRAVLTMLSIVTAFLLFGLLQGLVSGIDNAVQATHADVLITQSKISQIDPLPISMLAQIRQVPGVKAATPLVAFPGTYQNARTPVPAYAIDPDTVAATDNDTGLPPKALAALKATRNGAILPSIIAGIYRLKVGDPMPYKALLFTNKDDNGAWPLQVVAIYQANPKDILFSRSILVNYDYVDQARTASTGTSSVYLVRVADPTQAGEVGSRIDAVFANSPNETKTQSVQQLVADQIKQIGDIGFVVRAVVSAAFFSLLFSVGAVMMQSVRERTPELAVLKTLGFTDLTVLALILAESLMLCLFAAAIGLGLANLAFPIVKTAVGLDVSAGPLLLVGFVIAAVLAIIAGLPPAWRGMRISIVDALAGR